MYRNRQELAAHGWLILCLLLVATQTARAVPVMNNKGMPGGGWLQAGCFHPADHNIMIVGGDACGSIYRTDDFGATWDLWNSGLQNNDWEDTQYVDDLQAVTLANGVVKFYAATHGGVYSRENTDTYPWHWSTSYAYNDTARYPLAYFSTADTWMPHRQAISFACLDWDGGSYLYAGAGRVRYNNDSYETSNYPGCDIYRTRTGCIDSTYAVWKLNINAYPSKWMPMRASKTFGAIRDISVARIANQDYVAVAARNGIFLKRPTSASWDNLSDNYLLVDRPGGSVSRPLPYGAPPDSELSGWSIHLTQRGDLYVAMCKHRGALPSGVYCIHGVTGDPTAVWHYADDNIVMPEFGTDMYGLAQTGRNGYIPQFVYMTVDEQPSQDVIYLGDRQTYLGLFRGINSLDAESFEAVSWASKVRGGDGNWMPVSFADEVGWLTKYGSNVIFHPMLFEGDGSYLAMQLNSRFHVSSDAGDTWVNAYCGGSEGEWTNRGYSQLRAEHIAFQPDGRCLFTAADFGLFRSTDGSQGAYEWLMPEFGTCTATNNLINDPEAYDVEVRPNWRGSGYDGIFVTFTEFAQSTAEISKLMMCREPTGQGREWINLSQWAPSPQNYRYYDFTFVNDDLLFVVYRHFPNRACGLFRVEYNSGTGQWDWSDATWNLDDVMAYGDSVLVDMPQDILHNSYNGSRVFLACYRSANDSSGGVWMLTDYAAGPWTRVFFGNGSNMQRCFVSLAQAANGSRLYAGASGMEGAHGGVVKCSNPAAATTAGNWSVLNNASGFSWYDDPPIWQSDLNPPVDLGKRGIRVQCMAVHPSYPDYVYVGMETQGFSQCEGIWAVNGTSWNWASRYEPYNGPYPCELTFNPYVQGQLLMGTHGTGLWRNGVVAGGKALAGDWKKAEPCQGRLLLSASKTGPRTVRFDLAWHSLVEVSVYDVRGRLVRKESLGDLPSGVATWQWDGRSEDGRQAASGIYLARLRAGAEEATTKFTLVR